MRGKNAKALLNNKYRSVKIAVSRLEIIHYSSNSVCLRFRQKYQADSYLDVAVKNLSLVRSGKEWKIKKETWRAVEAKAPF